MSYPKGDRRRRKIARIAIGRHRRIQREKIEREKEEENQAVDCALWTVEVVLYQEAVTPSQCTVHSSPSRCLNLKSDVMQVELVFQHLLAGVEDGLSVDLRRHHQMNRQGLSAA